MRRDNGFFLDTDGEPRTLDTDLAERLGFSQPRDIRKIIKRHEHALKAMGVCATVTQTSGAKGERATVAYCLNRQRAIYITTQSGMPKAVEIAVEVIKRFDAYERGEFAPDGAAARGSPEAVVVPRTSLTGAFHAEGRSGKIGSIPP